MKKDKVRIKKFLKNAAILIIGNLLLAFSVAAFVIPHNVIMGGATGIGIVLSKIIPLDTATIVLIFNILMLILGGFVLGRRFLLTTITSSLLYPFFLSVVQAIPGIETITSNELVAALFGGGLLGVALGMIMGIGSSSGGTDVLNLVINKWFHIPVATAVYLVDIFIMGAQLFFTDVESILYGIILLVIETFVLDHVLVSGQTQLQILAISEKHEELRYRLLTELEAGVTMLFIETGCVCKEQKAVMCVIPQRKLHAATELIQSIDPSAFVTVTQIKEVRGQGFTRDRKPFDKGACVLPREKYGTD